MGRYQLVTFQNTDVIIIQIQYKHHSFNINKFCKCSSVFLQSDSEQILSGRSVQCLSAADFEKKTFRNKQIECFFSFLFILIVSLFCSSCIPDVLLSLSVLVLFQLFLLFPLVSLSLLPHFSAPSYFFRVSSPFSVLKPIPN